MFLGKYSLKKYIITKTLGNINKYKNPMKLPHVALSLRMKERDEGNAPKINERVPFIYTYNIINKKIQSENVEHPDFVKENNLQIDYLFYLEHQIKNPCLDILNLCVKSEYPNVENIFDSIIEQQELIRKNDILIYSLILYQKNENMLHEIIKKDHDNMIIKIFKKNINNFCLSVDKVIKRL